MQPIRVHIIYHSDRGHTRCLAEAIASGAESVRNTEVQLIEVSRAAKTHVTTCDALILGCPTYMGNVSSPMKEFIDTVISQIWTEGGIPGKVGACFTSSGSYHGGKEFTLFAFLSTLFQLGMTVVSLPPGQITENRALGFTFGAGTSSINTGENEELDANEKATAFALGARVAQVTQQFKRGEVS